VRVVFGRMPEPKAGLFDCPWMDAAEAWAAEQGQRIEQWRIDQRFRIGERWFAIAWRKSEGGRLGFWDVQPCTQQ
jgi:hypothetical protein